MAYLGNTPVKMTGATGAGGDKVFFNCDAIINYSYVIPNGMNSGSFGPITIADGEAVTIPDGSVWTIV